jgi:hypothetical protein
MNRSNPSAAESTSEVSAALVPRAADMAADIDRLIVQEIPALRGDTVQYRLRKAEESMRRPVVQDRLRIELALLATQWLGPAVLRSVGDPP